jgi:hypothetical protein
VTRASDSSLVKWSLILLTTVMAHHSIDTPLRGERQIKTILINVSKNLHNCSFYATNGIILANIYDIPCQLDNLTLDCFTHTSNWFKHLTSEMHHPLRKDDFIFPAIASTGKLKFGVPVGRSEIEKMLDKFVLGADLLSGRSGKFTTHCFCRGGAQWRFMWRTDRKWSLKAVKWWRGWAPTESVSSSSICIISYS